MAEIFEIRSRIESLEKINDITYAMEIITITRLKLLTKQSNKIRNIMADLNSIVAKLFYDLDLSKTSYLKAKKEQIPLLVIFIANRGFCGNFSQNSLAEALKFCAAQKLDFNNVEKLIVGKKADHAIKSICKQNASFFEPKKDLFEKNDVDELFKILKKRMALGQPIYFVSSIFKSIVSQLFGTQQYFPINEKKLKADLQNSGNTKNRPYFIEPNKKYVLEQVIQHYFYLFLQSVVADSSCSEFSQRFMIMKNAGDNIKEIKEDLKSELNKERQQIITADLSEIIGTYKALQKQQ